MPALKAPRREKFAQEVAKAAKTGKSVTQCYEASGYTTTGHASEAASSRLLSSVEVKNRVNEILAPVTKKTRISVESLLSELEITINDARGAKQHAVVVNALGLSAKLVGLLRDRIEVGGVGEFDHLQTLEDVARAAVAEMGAPLALETLDSLRASVADLAANQATVVEPAYQRRDEVKPALAALRNGRHR